MGKAPRTKETLPDFLKWRRVTRHPLVFRGLTGSQRTPGFRGVTAWYQRKKILCRKIWNGLLPICIARKKNCIVGCKAKLYCKRRPLHCIVAGLRVFILQYTVWYCRKKNQCIAMGIVLQDGCRRPKCVAIQNCIVTRGAGTGRRRGAGRAG